MISREYSLSRMAIWKILRKLGVDTRIGVATQRDTTCSNCGEEFKLVRSRWRRSKHHFCDSKCYYMWLEVYGSISNPWRQGQRLGRIRVERLWGQKIPEGAVVHHENGDCHDNQEDNLVVFASQADHIKWHRGKASEVEPLWDGVKLYNGVYKFK
jgi:hypothetical protein